MSETKDNLFSWRIEGRWWVRGDGLRLPVIQGGGPAVTVQNDKYAFGDDDGSESGHSLDTENTPRASQVADVTFMFRVQIEETNGGTESSGYTLFAAKNGGAAAQIPYSSTNNGLRLNDDTQSRTDDENTTQRLSYGGSTGFRAGKYDDGTTSVGTGSFSLDQDNTGVTDLEFALYIDSANASDSDYWDLEVRFSGGGALDGYPGTLPRLTASISAQPQTVVLDTAPMTIAGVASDIDAPQTTGLNTATLAIAGVTSQVNRTVRLQSGALTLSGVAFDYIHQTVKLSTAAITLAGVASDILVPAICTLSTATISVAGVALQVNQTVNLSTATIAVAGVTSQINQTVNLSTATLTVTGVPGELDAPISRTMSTAALTFAGVNATVDAGAVGQTIILDTAAITLTGVTTSINAPIAIIFDTAPMTLAGVLFTVSAGGGVIVELETA